MGVADWACFIRYVWWVELILGLNIVVLANDADVHAICVYAITSLPILKYLRTTRQRVLKVAGVTIP